MPTQIGQAQDWGFGQGKKGVGQQASRHALALARFLSLSLCVVRVKKEGQGIEPEERTTPSAREHSIRTHSQRKGPAGSKISPTLLSLFFVLCAYVHVCVSLSSFDPLARSFRSQLSLALVTGTCRVCRVDAPPCAASPLQHAQSASKRGKAHGGKDWQNKTQNTREQGQQKRKGAQPPPSCRGALAHFS